MDSAASIAHQVQRISADFGLTPIIACEVEFYLTGSLDKDMHDFWDEVTAACCAAAIDIFKIEKERGAEQHEIALMPSAAEKAAFDIAAVKKILGEHAALHNITADFSAKPYHDQPGSGLHVHIHLEDANRKNSFWKNDADISDSLKYSIGGLLAALPGSMPIFAPNSDSKHRFVAGSNAPLTVSWGANNRTTAIRIPDSEPEHKRIEHRVAGADADPVLVIDTILSAIHTGLMQKLDPGAQIYGDASLAQYNLPKIF